jgi:hypothetical protein
VCFVFMGLSVLGSVGVDHSNTVRTLA